MKNEEQSFLISLPLWLKLALSALSGVLLVASMPGYDVPFLGWIALIPMLVVVMIAPAKQGFLLALPFSLIFSIGVHRWYPQIFSPALGYFLIIAVGTFYAGIIQLGVWLQSRLVGTLRLIALPVTWAGVEFIKFIAPVVDDWWFVLLAKSQWRYPPALQILSATGFPGLSFLVMLANVSLAFMVIRLIGIRKQETGELDGLPLKLSAVGLGIVSLVLVWGALFIPEPPVDTFTVAALTDMVNQDPDILSTSEFAIEDFGTSANSSETSQAIFNIDAALSRQIAGQEADFIVWPENEFADADDAHFIDQLKGLAQDTESYIIADVVWYAFTGMHDTALMIGPAGEEIGRRAKINITDGEENVGFVPGPLDYPVFDTPNGKVGLGVCWDRHRLFITRELARNGAQIVLMTVDDDFSGNPWFPPFHASDGVFRAVENRTAFGLGTINGLSMVIDPYGRIMAEGEINERGVIIGEVFTVSDGALYTRWGDWFGWLMALGVIYLSVRAVYKCR